MAMVNVNRENSDPYYRYKMPRLMAKVGGAMFVLVLRDAAMFVLVERCFNQWDK